MEERENKTVSYSLSEFKVGKEGLEETGAKSIIRFVTGQLNKPTEEEYLAAKESEGGQEIVAAYEAPHWEGILHSHVLKVILADLKMRRIPGFSMGQAAARLEEALFWMEKQG